MFARRHALLASLVLVACAGDVEPQRDAPFVAFATDFDGYGAWEHVDLDGGLAPGNDHLNGPRRVYINQRPPAGSHTFPVGTIVVKETEVGPADDHTVFALVKRGAGFNRDGAVDWEWFQLHKVSAGSVRIVWRGVGPADGDVYGGDKSGGCNACHGTSPQTDYVLTPEIAAMLAR